MQILIAEDSPPARLLLQEVLRISGHQCLTAEDGLQAWELFQSNHVSFVITDWVMPRMDGRAAFEHVQSTGQNPRCIFMSGYSERAIHQDFLTDHRIRVIGKPFANSELLNAVREELDREDR